MYERVLVPLDGSELAEVAIGYAKELAIKCGAEIALLHVCHTIDSHLRNTNLAYLEHHAEVLRQDLREAGLETAQVDSVVVIGDPATEILSYAEQNNVSLIVMTTHGRSGLTRWIRGSVADNVVRHSQIPVRLVRSSIPGELVGGELPERRILALLDGSALAEQVLPYVASHSKMFNAQVTLLRVCEASFITSDYPEASMQLSWEEHVERIRTLERQQCRSYLEDMKKDLEDQGLGVTSESILSEARPVQEIIGYIAKDPPDLVALTTHGRSGVMRWSMGSLADRLLHEVSTPLLLIRAH